MTAVAWSASMRSAQRSTKAARTEQRSDPWISAIAIGTFVIGSAIWIARKGLFIHADTVVLWVLAGLFALTLTDLSRWGLRLLVDWLPLAFLLIFYEQSAPLVKLLKTPIHVLLQVKFDRLVFGKPILTVQFQHLLGQTQTVRWFDYPMWAIYMTHFFMALVIAGYLWRFSYSRFRPFRTQIVILTAFGFVTYILFPAAPPWYVADRLHELPWIYRSVFDTWGRLGLHTAGSIVDGAIDGNDLGNQFAAVPSMHAAVSLFVACFFWRTARPWLRVVLVVYVLGMAFTLVASGEHYAFDIFLGWFYAVAVVSGAALIGRRRRARSARRAGDARRDPEISSPANAPPVPAA